jgi:tRNA threonylcarbamoyladenosine biosynthesis protein TsaE
MFREARSKIFQRIAINDLPGLASEMLKSTKAKVWIFRGQMGAGKTTFIKSLCGQLGVTDTMSSPTFSIVNEYETASGDKVFHFDFFRVKSEAEAVDIGVEEYFYSGSYCFIEWPERIEGLIPEEHIVVRITPDTETLRTIELSVQ